MTGEKIKELFQIQGRFFRSTHLERDFDDPSALEGYILTEHIENSIQRLASGLAIHSGHRSWRITGDYGAGKSSFALLLAHLFSEKNINLPPTLQKVIDFNTLGIVQPQLLPILITGSREALAVGLLRALKTALVATDCRQDQVVQIIDRIQNHLENASTAGISDGAVLEVVQEVLKWVTSNRNDTGLLIIIDELGKYLEFAAYYPKQQDVYLLQKLAETAARSGNKPIFIVGVLHQGFNAYIDQLPRSTINEWEKVAGRFDEILFNQPLEQTTNLVAHALNTRHDQLPQYLIDQARSIMEKTLSLGWYGPTVSHQNLLDHAAHIYPLHPTVLPVLVKLFSRFGQNERSLFSFLFSNEPFALQAFAEQQIIGAGCFYRLHNLYDYVRATFGHRLSAQSYRSHWNLIDSLIESFHTEHEVSLQILKTVGLLNLLDTQNLLASPEVIALAVSTDGTDEANKTSIEKLLRALKERYVLYSRGVAGGYCLWPHTSVNLEQAYLDSERSVPPVQRVSSLVRQYLETRSLVARRHYIKTGNLRYFDVRYLPVSELATIGEIDIAPADGCIVIALCETEEEHQAALSFAQSDILKDRPEILLAVPTPLYHLANLIREMQRWQWIAEKTPELNSDRYAAQEVSRQITAAQRALERHLQKTIGLQTNSGQMELQWFQQNQHIEIRNSRDLLTRLSDMCDEIYVQAPHISNELVNRHTLSSAAAMARMLLIGRIFEYPSEPRLGMDATKKPPEMSMYLSVLKNSGLHQEIDGIHVFLEPENDPRNVRPALQCIKRILEEKPNSRIKITEIFAQLRRPPYGVRDGLIPILLAVFAIIHRQHIAFYEDDRFLLDIDGFAFRRLIKAPETFEIQFCEIIGVRVELFHQLLEIVAASSLKTQVDVLDVVRPLAKFAANLPQYTQRTKKLSTHTQKVRFALFNTHEPATLIFNQLPEACGFAPFDTDESVDGQEVQRFTSALKNALDELRVAYFKLQNRMQTAIIEAFGVSGSLEAVRDTLSNRAANILALIQEPRLKAFCLRLRDHDLANPAWLESLGSFLCSKPPTKWQDNDEEIYHQELTQLCARFQRVESIAFRTNEVTPFQTAFHLALTASDGLEVDQVFYISEEEAGKAESLEIEIIELLRQNGRVGLLAASRAFWNILSEQKQQPNG